MTRDEALREAYVEFAREMPHVLFRTRDIARYKASVMNALRPEPTIPTWKFHAVHNTSGKYWRVTQ